MPNGYPETRSSKRGCVKKNVCSKRPMQALFTMMTERITIAEIAGIIETALNEYGPMVSMTGSC